MNNWQELLSTFGIAIGSIIAKELIWYLKKYITTPKHEKITKKLKKYEKGIEKCKRKAKNNNG